MGIRDDSSLTKIFNGPGWLEAQLAQAFPKEKDAVKALAAAIIRNVNLPYEDRAQDLARLKRQFTDGEASKFLDLIASRLLGRVIREVIGNATSAVASEAYMRQHRTDAIWQVRGVEDKDQVNAYAALKILYSGDSKSLALINKKKYEELSLKALLDEIIDPTTGLFSAAEIKELQPLAFALKANNALPEDKQLAHLAGLLDQYPKKGHRN